VVCIELKYGVVMDMRVCLLYFKIFITRIYFLCFFLVAVG
jgi:hypothetical protein